MNYCLRRRPRPGTNTVSVFCLTFFLDTDIFLPNLELRAHPPHTLAVCSGQCKKVIFQIFKIDSFHSHINTIIEWFQLKYSR